MRHILNLLIKSTLSKKLVATLLLIIICFTTCITLYSYGIASTTLKERIKYMNEVREYEVILTRPQNYDQIEKQLHNIDNYYGEIERISIQLSGLNIISVLKGTHPFQVHYGKGIYESNEKQIVIGDGVDSKEYKVGDIYRVLGNEFNVIGIRKRQMFHEINPSSLQSNTQIENLVIEFTEIPNKKFQEVFSNELEILFSEALIIEPREFSSLNILTSNFHFLVSILLIVLAILIMSFLYKYILIIRKRTFGILRLCGCTKVIGVLGLYIEIIVIMTVIFIVSSILYLLFFEQILIIEHVYDPGSLNIFSVLLAYGQTVLIATIILFPRIVKYSGSSPKKLLIEEEI